MQAGGVCGVIEISLWIVRVFFNVCGLVVIQALWSGWREEKSIFRSLNELSVVNGGVAGLKEQHLGIPGHHKLRESMRFQPQLHPRFAPALSNQKQDTASGEAALSAAFYNRHQDTAYAAQTFNSARLGYNNPAFSSSSQQLSGYIYGSKPVHRSASSVSRLGSLARPQSHYHNQGFSSTESHRGSLRAPRLLSQSQFSLASFGLEQDDQVFLQGSGAGGLPLNIYRNDSRRDKLLGETLEGYRPRSLGSLVTRELDSVSVLSDRFQSRGRGEYQSTRSEYRPNYPSNRPDIKTTRPNYPSTRPDYKITRPYYQTQSLGRRMTPSPNLSIAGYHSDNNHGEQTLQGSRGSLGQVSAVSDSPERYQDIAL